MVERSIKACEIDHRRYLCKNIYLAGGTSLLPGNLDLISSWISWFRFLCVFSCYLLYLYLVNKKLLENCSCYNPVSTQRRFDVNTTLFGRQQRCYNVERTPCTCWEPDATKRQVDKCNFLFWLIKSSLEKTTTMDKVLKDACVVSQHWYLGISNSLYLTNLSYRQTTTSRLGLPAEQSVSPKEYLVVFTLCV